MNAHFRSVLIGFGITFVLVQGASACSGFESSSNGNCDCPKTPAQPTAQAPLPVQYAYSSEASRQGLGSPVDVKEGTFEVKPDSVVIQYQTDAGQYEVVYDVMGPVTY